MNTIVCNRRPSKAFVRRPGFGFVIALYQVLELTFYLVVDRPVCLMLLPCSPAMFCLHLGVNSWKENAMHHI